MVKNCEKLPKFAPNMRVQRTARRAPTIGAILTVALRLAAVPVYPGAAADALAVGRVSVRKAVSLPNVGLWLSGTRTPCLSEGANRTWDEGPPNWAWFGARLSQPKDTSAGVYFGIDALNADRKLFRMDTLNTYPNPGVSPSLQSLTSGVYF